MSGYGRRRQIAALAFIFLVLLIGAGCGGGSSPGGGGIGPTPTSITSVTVFGPANMQSPYCSNFTATVAGTGNYDHSVQWYVGDVAGGTTASGLVDSTGNYCAPAQPPADNPVSIKAVSNGDITKSGSVSTRVISISLSPTQAKMFVGDTQQFTTTVSGAADSSVTWVVNGTSGGNSSVGTISQSGLYTAPAQVTDDGIAVGVYSTDPSIEQSANITVSGRIVISPSAPQLTYGDTRQFTATLVGTTDTQVNWRANYGSISSSGLYTASAMQSPATVTASSTHATGSTTVKVSARKPTITGISPQPATALDQITINGTDLNPSLTAVFSDSLGGQIPVVSYDVHGTSATVPVPQGAVSGPFFVLVNPGGLSPAQSNTVQFQRLARLRLYSSVKDLGAGESVTLQYALMGDATPRTVTFSTDLGSFSGAKYSAPSSIPTDTFAHVTGCITGTTSCGTLTLAVHPFRVGPDVPIVAEGQSLQLSALVGGGTNTADWSLLTGGGSISDAGLYIPGTTLRDGGPAVISAVSSGTTETASVGVTGAFPGLVNRIYEYADQHDPNFKSSFPQSLSVIGNRLYVAATNYIGGHTDSYYWIDVYDITDPVHPVWLTAVESYSGNLLPAFGQYLYSYDGIVPLPGYNNSIVLYSIQNGVPVLKARVGTQDPWNVAWNQGVLTYVAQINNPPPSTFELLVYDLTSGSVNLRDLFVPLPPDADNFLPYATLAVGNRLFVSEETNDFSAGGDILTYDLSSTPPTLLGSIAARSLRFYSSGNLLFGANGGMEIYDISSTLPVFQSYIDGINAENLNGTQLLADTEQQGCQLLDVSDPQQPKVTTILFDGVINSCDSPTFTGKYLIASEYVGGIAIYDTSTAGGPIVKTTLYGGGGGASDDYDLLLKSPYLYGAASTDVGATLNVYDISTTPATRVGQYLDQSQQGFAIQSSGNYAYFGMSSNTAVLDITQPSSPALVANLSVPAVSFARVSNTLFAGSLNNALVIIDITNPAAPGIVNTIPLPDIPVRMSVAGTLLLVADDTGGLFIYDISSPRSPVLVSRVTTFAWIADVKVVGSSAYVAADVDGLAIFDITNPAHPVLISATSLSRIDPFYYDNPPNQALSVAVSNGLAYVGTLDDNGLVFTLDCTNPAVPRIVGLNAYGDFVETWVSSLVFHGSDLFVGGSLGFAYPVVQADISHPFDAIGQYFPPAILQNPASLNVAGRRAGNVRMGKRGVRFPRTPPAPEAAGNGSRTNPSRFHR